MRVYVVQMHGYDDRAVLGVYSTRKRAEAAAEASNPTPAGPGYPGWNTARDTYRGVVGVEPYDVDSDTPSAPLDRE